MPALRPRWPSCAVRRGVSIRSRSLAPRGAAAATGAVKGAAAAEEVVGVLEGAAAAKGAMEAEEVAASAKAAVEVKESMENAAAVGVVMVREAVVMEAVVREAVVRETVAGVAAATAMPAVVARQSVVLEPLRSQQPGSGGSCPSTASANEPAVSSDETVISIWKRSVRCSHMS